MIAEGRVVIFRFPETEQAEGKLRPAIVVRQLPGQYNDWLICLIPLQLHHKIPDFGEVIDPNDLDFKQSALILPGVIRISRFAVIDETLLPVQLGKFLLKGSPGLRAS